jgi:hypothetical protein
MKLWGHYYRSYQISNCINPFPLLRRFSSSNSTVRTVRQLNAKLIFIGCLRSDTAEDSAKSATLLMYPAKQGPLHSRPQNYGNIFCMRIIVRIKGRWGHRAGWGWGGSNPVTQNCVDSMSHTFRRC